MEVIKEITLTRILNAPREVVFKAWTDPDQMMQWWAPRGFVNRDCEMDVRPGGKWQICMESPEFPDHWVKGEFQEVTPDRLVFTSNAFIGENGVPGLEGINIVTFEEEGSKTKLTLTAKILKAAPGLEAALQGMNEGWSQSLDKMVEFADEPFVTERTFNAPASKIWSAITDRDEMSKWYFDLAAFKPEPGFEFQFVGGPPDKSYTHLCKVTEVTPGRKITYSWRYEGYEGNSFVSWELFDEGGKTKLRLTHVGLETFPASNPDLAKHNFAEGWTQIIHTSLQEYLDKNN